MKSDQNRTELFRARVYNAGAIVAAGVAVERLTISHGIGPLEASRFRFAVEELCAERISTGFAADEQPELRLVLELRPGEIAVTIEDAGSPIDAAAVAAGAKGWLAHLLERRFADSLRASFEGRAGNRCEMVKSLGDSARASLSDSGAGGSSTRAEIEADAGGPQPGNLEAAKSIQYRNMAPEDALEVARCFYRTYGFTAPIADEVIYHPEKCAALVRDGLHLGTVAALADGRIIGHIAVTREHPQDPVGTSGFLVVDPEFRGHGIGDRLSDAKPIRAREAGMRGMLGMTVTVHTASQKTSLREGGHEVGVLLAAQEDRIVMRAIASEVQHERHAIVPFFTPLAVDISREIFPPACYRDITQAICAACDLPRTIREAPAPDLTGLPDSTKFAVSLLEGARFARIRITSYGRNALSEILHVTEDLHGHHVRVIRLELPLADPITAYFGAATEHLGFSFAAIFPATEAGDLLCVQSLDRIEINREAIHIASEHGSAILAAVLASRDRMLSTSKGRVLADAMLALRGTRPDR